MDWFSSPTKSLEEVVAYHTTAQLNFMQRGARKN